MRVTVVVDKLYLCDSDEDFGSDFSESEGGGKICLLHVHRPRIPYHRFTKVEPPFKTVYTIHY